MDIKFNQSTIHISSLLFIALKKAIKQNEVDSDASQLTVNYRDTNYSSEAGGYHPVEIALQKNHESGRWSLLYVTDFSYYGSELAKDLDFDFSMEQFNCVYMPSRKINYRDVIEVFNIWQDNFLSYLEYGAFDEIEVTADR